MVGVSPHQIPHQIHTTSRPAFFSLLTMIDFQHDELLTLTEAAALLPSARRGRKVNATTIGRWAKHGIRGVKLESILVGCARKTTREALQQFFRALAKGEAPAIRPQRAIRREGEASAMRQARVERELQAAGL